MPDQTAPRTPTNAPAEEVAGDSDVPGGPAADVDAAARSGDSHRTGAAKAEQNRSNELLA